MGKFPAGPWPQMSQILQGSCNKDDPASFQQTSHSFNLYQKPWSGSSYRTGSGRPPVALAGADREDRDRCPDHRFEELPSGKHKVDLAEDQEDFDVGFQGAVFAVSVGHRLLLSGATSRHRSKTSERPRQVLPVR